MRPVTSIEEYLKRRGKEAPTKAERAFIAAIRKGEDCTLGDGTRPEGPSPDRTIRAPLLRAMILGGTEDCSTPDWGVRLRGAYVAGELDLGFARAKGATGLLACRFEESVAALQADFQTLNLSGAHLPGLMAQGIRVTSDVFLRALDTDTRFEAEGEVRLSGAEIGGQLSCQGARFANAGCDALNAQGARVTGGVFLRALDTDTRFEAEGEVRLSGAEIGGQFACTGARLANAGGKALHAQRVWVGASFFWKDVRCPSGRISLGAAHVGDLCDELASWPEGGRLILDGFTYDRIAGAATDARTRLDWLARGSTWQGEFIPQPYVQLAKVLFAQGHRRDARKVQMERERLTRAAQRRRPWSQARCYSFPFVAALHPLRWLWSQVLRFAVGYGYAPWRALVPLLALWGGTVWLAHAAWEEGSFAPNSDVILTSEDWRALDAADCHGGAAAPGCVANPAEAWSAQHGPGMDWDSFSRYGYAADLVVPVLALGQTDAWAPSKDRGPFGRALWWGRWVIVGLGWIIALLAAAAVTGVIRREEEGG